MSPKVDVKTTLEVQYLMLFENYLADLNLK